MLLLNGSATTSRGHKPALTLFLAEPLRAIASHAVFPFTAPIRLGARRGDGIVGWHACVETAGPDHENVAVCASHLGIGVNPAALWVVADRVAQTEGNWQLFIPPARFGALYPDPV